MTEFPIKSYLKQDRTDLGKNNIVSKLLFLSLYNEPIKIASSYDIRRIKLIKTKHSLNIDTQSLYQPVQVEFITTYCFCIVLIGKDLQIV